MGLEQSVCTCCSREQDEQWKEEPTTKIVQQTSTSTEPEPEEEVACEILQKPEELPSSTRTASGDTTPPMTPAAPLEDADVSTSEVTPRVNAMAVKGDLAAGAAAGEKRGAAPSEKRIDPNDGHVYNSFQEFEAYYTGIYKKREIRQYWEKTCKPLKKGSKTKKNSSSRA
mmetsp:Transcript_40629/g.73077  ORF Transcript_40629/g.73077 Transcript_40629/m.73077 type:complete len:170 (-) Transcript_40629:97-606(-)